MKRSGSYNTNNVLVCLQWAVMFDPGLLLFVAILSRVVAVTHVVNGSLWWGKGVCVWVRAVL